MRVSNSLLEDTLSLVSLAREAARARGIEEQAQRLSPVVDELRSLVDVKNAAEPVSPSASADLAGADFKHMLEKMNGSEPVSPLAEAPQAKNHVVLAMAEGGMSELDIARYMGVSREEVRLILNVSRPASSTGGR